MWVSSLVLYVVEKDIPNLILIKCICHLLHLVSCNANEEMPSCLDYMLRETFDCFHKSALRKQKYMDQMINDEKEPLQFVSLYGIQ